MPIVRVTRAGALGLSMLAFACASVGHGPAVPSHDDARILLSMVIERARGTYRLETPIVLRETIRFAHYGDPWRRAHEPALPDSLIAAAAALPSSGSIWTPDAFGVPVELVTAAEGRARAEQGLGGTVVIGLSALVFNADTTAALIYYEARCGTLCGGGVLLWFAKSPNGAWELRRAVQQWIS